MTTFNWILGSDHSYVRAVRRERHEGRAWFRLSLFSRAAVVARGGEFSRDDERAYRDLQAAASAREAGR